jgi:hypothetical protein
MISSSPGTLTPPKNGTRGGLGPTDFWTTGLLDSWTSGLLDSRTFGLSDFLTSYSANPVVNKHYTIEDN